MSQEQRPLDEFLKTLYCRKWLILLCLLATLAPVMYYNATAPRVYEASATLIYEEPRMQLGMRERPSFPWNRDVLLNQIQEIKSRSVAEAVIRALPDSVKAQLPMPEDADPDYDRRNHLGQLFRENLKAAPMAESDVIEVSVRAENDPRLAQILTNTLCDVLQERNLRLRTEQMTGLRAFIEGQQFTYQQKLKEAEEALRRFKVENRVTAMDKEIEEQLRLATSIELRYQEAKSNRQKTADMLASVNEKIISHQDKLAPSIADLSNQRLEELKSQYTSLQKKFINLQLQGIPDSNPTVQELQKNMQRIREQLAEEARRLVETDQTGDLVEQMSTLMQRKFELELEMDMLRSQEDSLRKSLQTYEASLRSLPEKEFQLARLTRERDLAQEIYLMLSERREETRINEAEQIANVRIIDRPRLPRAPVQPRSLINLVVAGMLGLGIGLGLAFFVDSRDTTLKSPEEIETNLGLPVLGSIPHFSLPKQNSSFLITLTSPENPASEAYRTLRTGLQFAESAKDLHSLLITSTGPQEGKSTTSANLAAVIAQMGIKTLLIDADLRRPALHKMFEQSNTPGLTDFLSKNGYFTGQFELKDREAAQFWDDFSQYRRPTGVDHLDLLPCGEPSRHPSEILALQSISGFLSQLEEKYGFIIIDAPPVLAVTDAAILATKADGALLVIESGRNELKMVQKALTHLNRVGVNVLGGVVNSINIKDLYGKYDYYYTYYNNSKGRNKKPRHEHV